MSKSAPELDRAAVEEIAAAIREVLIKKAPDRAIGLAACLLLAGRTIAVVATCQQDFDEGLASAHNLLEDSSRADFAARQRSARRGRRNATQH